MKIFEGNKIIWSFKFACFLLVLLFVKFDDARGQTANFYLKDGDRVVFYGDSITEQSFYTNFVETYALTRFPKWKINFTNSGWSGDRIYGGGGGAADERIKRDILAYKPTVLTAMFGMNDGCYVEFNQDCYKGFTDGYERFLGLLKKDLPALRVTLLAPSPFDDWTNSGAWRLAPPVKSGYNQVLIRYAEFVESLAKKNDLTFADLNQPLADAIRKAQKKDANQAQKIIPDRIHPSNAGGLLMAFEILKKWNAPPTISFVEIDAQTTKTIRAEKTRISDLKKSGKRISWTQTDESLPLPIDRNDKTMQFVLQFSDVVERLNREILQASNLDSASYELKIDGEKIGEFSRADLERGINLANFPTPMFRQAQTVHELTEKHNRIHFVRWREIQIPFEKENAAQTLRALDELEAATISQQRLAAQPKPHRYELTAIE